MGTTRETCDGAGRRVARRIGGQGWLYFFIFGLGLSICLPYVSFAAPVAIEKSSSDPAVTASQPQDLPVFPEMEETVEAVTLPTSVEIPDDEIDFSLIEDPTCLDEVWLVSTRGVGCPSSVEEVLHRLRWWRYRQGHGWRKASWEEFQTTAAPASFPLTTSFFVHGNRISSGAAKSGGLATYRRLTGCSRPLPVRFVIWSWPSDQQGGPIRDARAKASRSDVDAYLMACCLSRMASPEEISLSGYSFGGRIITGALHLLGGGSLCGRHVEYIGPAGYQVVLLAPALNNDWLLPGRRHGQAAQMTQRLLVMFNPRDWVLKRYHVLSRGGRPRALGFTGLAGRSRLESAGVEVRQVNTSGVVGKQHDLQRYLSSSRLVGMWRDFSFPRIMVETAP